VNEAGGVRAAGHSSALEEADRRARREVYWHERIHRFSALERVLHWVIAATGIICLLSGIGWYAGSFQFLLTLFGGGEAARWIHGLAGILMTACAVVLFGVIWARHMFRFIPEDWQWLKISGGYLRRHTRPAAEGHALAEALPEVEEDVPPQGFFNGGQKLWGILALALSIVFLVSGLAIWSPELWRDFLGLQPLSVPLMRVSYVLHDAAFIIFAPMVIFHIYLSTILNPGTLEAMTKGDVTRLWALHHHPLWYEEAVGRAEVAGD
jgi:cytochrome b subunit of formate dehydrogenase